MTMWAADHTVRTAFLLHGKGTPEPSLYFTEHLILAYIAVPHLTKTPRFFKIEGLDTILVETCCPARSIHDG